MSALIEANTFSLVRTFIAGSEAVIFLSAGLCKKNSVPEILVDVVSENGLWVGSHRSGYDLPC